MHVRAWAGPAHRPWKPCNSGAPRTTRVSSAANASLNVLSLSLSGGLTRALLPDQARIEQKALHVCHKVLAILGQEVVRLPLPCNDVVQPLQELSQRHHLVQSLSRLVQELLHIPSPAVCIELLHEKVNLFARPE
mmetsp:Transcript_68909/g.190769  ORF Transcript_68909/g.190769 Transcript_68909/m.190769 type:complete len:135 (-) Transcript_68909:313-717(-)